MSKKKNKYKLTFSKVLVITMLVLSLASVIIGIISVF